MQSEVKRLTQGGPKTTFYTCVLSSNGNVHAVEMLVTPVNKGGAGSRQHLPGNRPRPTGSRLAAVNLTIAANSMGQKLILVLYNTHKIS